MSDEAANDSGEVIPSGMTAGELIKHLSKYPPDTEVYIESTSEVDTVSGGIFFPDLRCVSLIGHDAEVEMDDEEFGQARVFGDVELIPPEEEGEEENEDAIASCVIEGAVEIPKAQPGKFEESDAPPRPAKQA